MTFATRFAHAALLIPATILAACGADDPAGPTPQGAATITADIVGSRTFRAETTYTLSGFIKVKEGATLTIEPGTTIVGSYDVPGSSLIVLPGGKLNAVGTAERPIVFTSSRPVGQRQAGDWGGLVLVGRGIVNRASPTILEGTGTGASNPQVNYAGGSNNDDSSGELRYVRVEFAGYATAADQELNSFTFAAVGRGTKLSHLQSLYGLDDAFEWFGGAVDATHLVSYEAGDDHFDMSEGFVGRTQFLIAYQSVRVIPRSAAGSPSGDPQGIENDGCQASNCLNAAGNNAEPHTLPVVANFTLVGTGAGVVDATAGGYGMVLRRGTGGHYVNGIVARWPKAGIALRDAATQQRMAAGLLTVRHVYAAENGETVQSGQLGLDASANAIETAPTGTTAASVFVRLSATPASAADLDWSLAAGATPRAGGMATFSGDLATRSGTVVTGTTYRGAADPAAAAKWWAGWTRYARN